MAENPHPDDHRWIAALLSAEADRHELDTSRLVARVMAEADRSNPFPVAGHGHRAGQEQNVRPGRPRRRSRAGTFRARPARPWLVPAGLAAAGLAIVATGGSLLPGLGGSTPTAEPSLVQMAGGETPASRAGPTPPHRTEQPAPSTTSPNETTSGTDVLPPPPSTLPDRAASAPSAPGPAVSGPDVAGPDVASPVVPAPVPSVPIAAGTTQVSANPVQGGHVELPVTGDRDWFVIAPETAGSVLHPWHTRMITGPNWYSRGLEHAASGPFTVAWSRSAVAPAAGTSTSWMLVSGPGTGFRVAAPAGGGTGVLILYVGVTGAKAHVAARLDGGVRGSSVVLEPSTDGAGYVVTIRFASLRSGGTVLVDMSGDQGAGVAVAGGELR